MAKYDWKIEPRDEDWSDDTYAYFLIHINLKKMVEYLTKEFKKDWWFKADYGQDNCYIVAENNNFPVRLFFTFDEGGWADITRHYTDGASYTDDHLGSWHFGKYDVDYSYAVIRDNIENYFYKFLVLLMFYSFFDYKQKSPHNRLNLFLLFLILIQVLNTLYD